MIGSTVISNAICTSGTHLPFYSSQTSFKELLINSFKLAKKALLFPFKHAQDIIQAKQSENKILNVQNAYNHYNKNSLDHSHTSSRNLEKAFLIIEELNKGGLVGIYHLGPLSRVIQRPIQIFNEKGKPVCIVGDDKHICDVVNIEYHRPTDTNPSGHWTLPKSIEAPKTSPGPNNCLFDVVAMQTQKTAQELRMGTVVEMRRRIQMLASVVEDIERLMQCNRVSLYLGGAAYRGLSIADAGRVLDKSQNVSGHRHVARGHPRGHASNPGEDGEQNSVEKYSFGSNASYPKSGFLNRDDQDFVCHLVLNTREAKEALHRLNGGSSREVIKVPRSSITGTLPMMGEWANGQMIKGPIHIARVAMVLQHHAGRANDADYDVHIHTCYPMAN